VGLFLSAMPHFHTIQDTWIPHHSCSAHVSVSWHVG
jgi:hypothetical protein